MARCSQTRNTMAHSLAFGTQAMVDRGNRNGIATNGMGKRKQRHAAGPPDTARPKRPVGYRL